MRSFTLHAAPPARASVPLTRPAPAPRPPQVVPEGFSWLAALLPPLWLLAHRLWLPLVACVALMLLLAFLPPPALRGPATLALHLLVGFEAHNLRRWALARRGLPVAGVVLARDAEAALLRALDARPGLSQGQRA